MAEIATNDTSQVGEENGQVRCPATHVQNVRMRYACYPSGDRLNAFPAPAPIDVGREKVIEKVIPGGDRTEHVAYCARPVDFRTQVISRAVSTAAKARSIRANP